MNLHRVAYCAFLGAIAFSAIVGPARFASATETTTEKSLFGIAANLEVANSLHEMQAAEHTSDATLLIDGSYSLSDTTKLGLRLKATQMLENEMETTFGDTQISASRKGITLNPFLTLTPKLAMTLPSSKASRLGDSLMIATSLQPKLETAFTHLGDQSPLSPLKITQSLSLTKNFHTFDTSLEGKANSTVSISYNLIAAYSLSDKWEISASALRGWGNTYHGHWKNNFELSEELSYSPTDKISLAVGHANGGAAYKENGTDSNIRIFNPNDSTVYGSLSVSY